MRKHGSIVTHLLGEWLYGLHGTNDSATDHRLGGLLPQVPRLGVLYM